MVMMVMEGISSISILRKKSTTYLIGLKTLNTRNFTDGSISNHKDFVSKRTTAEGNSIFLK